MKKLLCCVILLFCFTTVHAESTGEILTFPANPAKGFHWGYALYLPKTLDASQKLPILFEMNNMGVTSSVEQTKEKVLSEIRHNSFVHKIPDGVGVPMLMPFVQRENRGNPLLYTHELNRAVFVSQEEKLKRLDLQVLLMIADARKHLKKRGIRTTSKVLVAGYSASGAFCWRWTMLHPDKVLAAACGGDHYPMLPVEKLDETELIYPVGVYDFKPYTGRRFNRKAWLKVPLLCTNGEMDLHDPLPNEDCWAADVERPILKRVLPEREVLGRMRHNFQLLNKWAPNVQTHLYPNVDHHAVTEDMIAFLKQHMRGGSLKPIALTDTTSWEIKLPGKVSTLFFGKEAPVPDKTHLDELDLILLSTPVPRGLMGCEVDILHQGKTAVTVQKKQCYGWFGHSKDGFSYIQINLSEEQAAQLNSYKDRTFTVRARHPEILDIPADLTFTVK